jgi:hypothetical protein
MSDVRAADKEVTLKGTITCAKCDLKMSDQCATVIKVNEGSKDVVYYFDKAAHKKYHKKICMEPTQGSVTGTVTEEGDKKIINVATLEMGK